MPLRLIRFIDCEIDGNWRFSKPGDPTDIEVRVSSWIREKKIIYPTQDGATIRVTATNSRYFKFKKNAVVSLEGNILAFNAEDVMESD